MNSRQLRYKDKNEVINIRRKDIIESSVRARMNVIGCSAKIRAKKKDRQYTLDLDFLCEMWEAQKGICALTGEELSILSNLPNTVSLDRIDSDYGYTQDNVWFVGKTVNIAKSDLNLEDFITMCNNVGRTMV